MAHLKSLYHNGTARRGVISNCKQFVRSSFSAIFSLLSLLSDFLRPRARDLLNGGRDDEKKGEGEREREREREREESAAKKRAKIETCTATLLYSSLRNSFRLPLQNRSCKKGVSTDSRCRTDEQL